MISVVAYLLIISSIPLLIYRLVKGPTWADRILTADLLMIYLVAGLLAIQTQKNWLWDRDVIWLVLTLGLVGVIGASLLMEDRGRG